MASHHESPAGNRQQTVNLFWFRRDLRLHDNAGLYHALRSGLPVVPVFIFDSQILGALENPDDRRVSFIMKALQQMQNELNADGVAFDIRYGEPLKVFEQLSSDNHFLA